MLKLLKLKQILERVQRPIDVRDEIEYACVGVRWWGQGAFVREAKYGHQIKKKRQFLIEKDDVVYNKLFAWRGAFAVADGAVQGCIVSDKFPTYRLVTHDVKLAYLKILFQSQKIAELASKKSTGMAAISKFTLNPPHFGDLQIAIPSLAEQDRIIDLVKRVGDNLENSNAALTRIEKCSKNIPRVIAHRETQDYPKVQIRNFGDLVRRSITIEDDKTYKQVTIGMNNTGLRLRGFKDGLRIAVRNQAEVTEGDLVFSRIDIRNGAIGFVQKDLSGAVVGNDFPVCVIDGGVSKAYLGWYFKTPKFRADCIMKSAGATNRKKMKRDTFLSLEIPMPDSRETQEELVSYLEAVNELSNRAVYAASRISRDLFTLRNHVLNRVFSGTL